VLGLRRADVVALADVAVRVGVGVGALDDGTTADRWAEAGALDRDGPPELQPTIARATNGSTDSGTRRTPPPSHAPVVRRRSAAPVRVLLARIAETRTCDDGEERGIQ
jgi:hypothetical protein